MSNSEGIRELFVLVNRELMELETHSHTRSHTYTHSTGGKKKPLECLEEVIEKKI